MLWRSISWSYTASLHWIDRLPQVVDYFCRFFKQQVDMILLIKVTLTFILSWHVSWFRQPSCMWQTQAGLDCELSVYNTKLDVVCVLVFVDVTVVPVLLISDQLLSSCSHTWTGYCWIVHLLSQQCWIAVLAVLKSTGAAVCGKVEACFDILSAYSLLVGLLHSDQESIGMLSVYCHLLLLVQLVVVL